MSTLAVLLLFAAPALATIPFAGSLATGAKQALSDLCESGNFAASAATLGSLVNWCTAGSNPCTWTSIACNGGGTQVTSFSISGNVTHPQGTLPSTFASNFRAVEHFTLFNVDVNGTVMQPFFSSSTALKSFLAIGAPLAEPFPTASAAAIRSTLTSLVVENTLMTGSLTIVGQLSNLVRLTLVQNNFDGVLPPSLGSLLNLNTLDLRLNRFSGPVPDSLCSMPNIQTIELTDNQFNELPSCLDNLPPNCLCDLRRNLFCQSQANSVPHGPCIIEAMLYTPYDRCGVCGGDGQSCADCLGVPFGTTEDDVCGVCGGGAVTPASCDDCNGNPGGGAVYDDCDVCDGHNASKDCTGACGGSAVYDACDVCDGDNSTCTDCAGTLFGTAVLDACGVCGGGGLSCRDCSGVPFGTRSYDACDVCNGNGLSCADCSGTPHGTRTYDRCDVCGGDGTLCGLGLALGENEHVFPIGWALGFSAFLVVLLIGCGGVFYAFIRRAGKRRAAFRRRT